jgi:DNA-binding MarR family transcriptional regulator
MEGTATAMMDDLKDWRTARKEDLMTRREYMSCSTFARRLARHLVTSRDALDGSGMFRSPRKLQRELDVSESTIRRALRELVEAGVFEKERRTDPRGTGRRHTTSAYRVHPALNVQPGCVPLRCVTNDRPIDTPTDTPRSSKLPIEESPREIHSEADVAVERTSAGVLHVSEPWLGVTDTGLSAGLAGSRPAISYSTSANEVYPPRKEHDESTARREYEDHCVYAAEWREAFQAVYDREPRPDEQPVSDYELYEQAKQLRFRASVPW